MLNNSLIRWSFALALSGAVLAAPADAQGKGKDKRPRERPELVRREDSFKARERALKAEQKLREERLKEEFRQREEALKRDRRQDRDDRWDDDRYEERYDERYEESRGNGPPFCRSGEGHPVHGRRWCEEKGYGLGQDARYEPWLGSRSSADGSYQREHDEFHRWHDRECRMRAAERPLDLQWQIRVRQECKVRHDEWHYRAGRSHG